MKVYKYRYGSQRDLESLKQDYFYAPNFLKLNDPYEGMYVDEILSASELHPYLKDSFSRFYEDIKSYGIYSLSKTAIDELLWAYYANSHQGFCIEYDQEVLLQIKNIQTYCVMEYGDDLPKLNFNSVFLNNSISKLNKFIFGKKSKRWQHEDEIRIIMDYFGKVEYDFRAVRAIYFGLRMPKTQQDLYDDNKKLPDKLSQVSQEQVMEVLKGRNIKYYQMKFKSNSYEFEYIQVIDPYNDVEKYKIL